MFFFFLNLCHHKHDFGYKIDIFLLPATENPHVRMIVVQLKGIWQKPWNNEILDFKAVLTLCKEEIKKYLNFCNK